VKIHSEIGCGTTVSLFLPRHHSRETAAEVEPLPAVARARPGETILVVEDETDVRAFTTETLRELGYDVVEASTGKTALTMLDRHPGIHLLFTDVGLPGGMNGRQLAEAARARQPRLKVLFTTGYARDAIIHDGRLDPGVVLITKPFAFATLAEKLRTILDEPPSKRRVLLVEDEALIQLLVTEDLESLGFDVELADSAAAARSKLRASGGGIDAAIVDMGLPDAKGDDLVRDLRAMYEALPIVIASGQDKATLRQTFSGQTNLGFMSKPFTTEDLRATLLSVGVSA
jgi:CheY-like chemotaxis protein